MSLSGIFQTAWIGRPHQQPLVGRARECERFLQILEEIEKAAHQVPGGDSFDPWSWSISPLAGSDLHFSADECIPQCLLLTGEAGIGKTRLAEEYGRLAQVGGWRVLWCQGREQTEKSPYSLWLNLFRTALALDIVYPQEVQQALLPLLEANWPLAYSDSPKAVLSGRESPFWLTGSEKMRVWEAASLLFTHLSSCMPLLIVVDDLGWSDSLSRELLAYLARSVAGSPILLVGTLRTFAVEDDAPTDTWRETLADLARKHLVQVMPVGSLDSRSLDLLLEHLGGPLSDDDYLSIRENSAGNPYFCEELVRYSASDGRKQTGSQESAVPPSLTRVLDEHVASVADFCQHMLSKAAVLGGNFTVNILAAMEDVVSPRVEEDLFQALEEALRAQIVTEIITKENDGIGVCYQFWHPLLASHLYERIPPQERKSIHQRAADVLCTRSSKEEDAAHILTHVLRGDARPHQVIQYGWLAGKRAYQLQAYPEAERAFRLVLERLPEYPVLPPTSQGQWNLAGLVEHDASSTLPWQSMLWELLGECLMVQGRYEDACQWYERVLSHSQCQAEGVLFPDTYLPQYRGLLWRELSLAYRYQGEQKRAWECQKRGREILYEAGITGGPAWACLSDQAASLYWQDGQYEQALCCAKEALALFQDFLETHTQTTKQVYSPGDLQIPFPLSRMRRTLQGDPVDVGRAQSLVGTLLALTGKSEEALDHLRVALAIFERHHYQREVVIVSDNLGDLLLRRGEFEQARHLLFRAKHIAEQIGDHLSLAITLGNLGLIAARSGELVDGERLHRSAYRLAEQVREPVFSSFCASTQAMLFYERGMEEDALACIRRAFSVGRGFSVCYVTALVKLGWMRIMHVQLCHDKALTLPEGHCRCQRCQHLLVKTEALADQILACSEIEAETRIEAMLLAVAARLLQGLIKETCQCAVLAVEEAKHAGLIWWRMIGERFMAQIQAREGKILQADLSLLEIAHQFHVLGMRLEEARTLALHGSLLRWGKAIEGEEVSERQQRGQGYLKEAYYLTIECEATLDQRRLVWLLDQAQLPIAAQ